jgi:hypothetical protein
MNAPRSGCPINLTLEALGGSVEPDRHPRTWNGEVRRLFHEADLRVVQTPL